jgi:Tfp pilus assembly protein PilE
MIARLVLYGEGKVRHSQAGFTTVELMVASVLVSIVVLIMGQFFASSLGSYTRSFTKTVLQSNTKLGIETLERDIKAAQAVEDPNRWPDNNAPGAPSDKYSWHPTSGSGATLVLSVPAKDAAGNVLFADPLHNTVQTNDVIYYLASGSKILYKRVIANPVSGNAAVTTCPPTLATVSCPADPKIVEDVANLSITYYTSNNTVTNNPPSAGLVELTLTQTQTKGSRVYTNSFTSKVSLRNK